MADILAPGAPGIAPRWTRGAKDAVGAAYSSSSRVWFTLAQGTLTEIYYPTVDLPQVRDLQFLFTDGATFFHGERRDCDAESDVLSPHALGYRVTTRDRQARYSCAKEIIADPHLSCVLLRARIEAAPAVARALRLYVLCAPHLEGSGWHNNAAVDAAAGRTILLACRDRAWMALSATVPLRNASAGYVGRSDGWSELARDFRLDHHYPAARDGNVALIGELDLRVAGAADGFTVGVAFGRSRHAAVNALLQSLHQPYETARARFLEQWERSTAHKLPLQKHSRDAGRLYDRSVSLILAHEDKTFPGAIIASLCIPWGEAKGDEDLGGYHLVWTRDLVNSATGLLAAGDRATAFRALIYLATTQRDDGGFNQNFWIDGRPYWSGIQLDEVAFPILLAWRLRQEQGLGDFDPYPMVMRAAGFLMREGPATPQERWEEAGGYSPSTLAAHIAGLVCAAEFAHARQQPDMARLCLEYADFLEAHIEPWTVTKRGSLLAGVPRHYIRINPSPLQSDGADEDPDAAILRISNRAPGEKCEFPARDIVDAGFLELARYGIRPAGDPLIEASLRVVDAQLKFTSPAGPCWRRYNHDGYGQRADGGAFAGWGVGRPWPLLAGERAHYEFAAGRAGEYVAALERFANHLELLPEQIWDQPDLPAAFLYRGRPTGSAMPLMWAHAEYIKLLRSIADGRVFDLIPAVAARYLKPKRQPSKLEIWKLRRRIRAIPRGARLRIQLDAAFFLHFSRDGWKTVEELRSTPTGFGFEYVDAPPPRPSASAAPLRFTFRWAADGRWQGEDYAVVAIN